MLVPRRYRPRKPIDTYDAYIPVSRMISENMADWPQELQDQVAAQVDGVNAARRAKGEERVAIAKVRVFRNGEDKWTVHVVLQNARVVEKWEGRAPERYDA